MFQCLGLGTQETGGCGEDWYHPGCLVGMGPNWFDKMDGGKRKSSNTVNNDNGLATISEANEDQPDSGANGTDAAVADDDDEPPMPPGFPDEELFEGFLCYKCVHANPWIKRYAGTSGFLPPVFLNQATATSQERKDKEPASNKRKAEDEGEAPAQVKRTRDEHGNSQEPVSEASNSEVQPAVVADGVKVEVADGTLGCKLPNLPEPPTGQFSLFFKEDFRDKFCRCTDCYRIMNEHPQLLEEEEVYEPPISEGDVSEHGSTHGSGSLLERGESALRNVDRVRAIEGVMAYNHLKEQLKPFFKQFAESGQAVGAEDIKAYFAKLRGDEQGIKEAGQAAADSKDGNGDGDGRKEQSGF